MMSVIAQGWQWLNANTGAVQAVATTLSLAAVMVVGFLAKKSSDRTITEMQAQRSLGVRPRLDVWPNAPQELCGVIEITDLQATQQPPAFFHLVNVGAGKAFNVRLHISGHPQFNVAHDGIVIPPEQAAMVRYPASLNDLVIVASYQDLDGTTHSMSVHVDAQRRITVTRSKPRKDRDL